MAAPSGAVRQIHRYARIGACVNRPVAPLAAVKAIRAPSAGEPVVPDTALQHIRAPVALEPVAAIVAGEGVAMA